MRIYDMKCTHDLCGRVFNWHTKPAIYNKSEGDNFRDVRCQHCGRVGVRRASEDAPEKSAREAIESLLTENGEMRLKDIIEATGLTTKVVHDVVYRDPGRIAKTSWGVYGLTGVSA